MGDLKFILNTHGRNARGGVSLSPAQFQRLPALVYEELYATLGRLGVLLTFELKFYFYKMIHERPRNPDYKGSSDEPLLQRMQKAFVSELKGDANTLKLMVFNIDIIDRATRNEGFNTGWKGWAMRFLDGHEGRRHGGEGWGFIEQPYAVKLAKECAEKFISKPEKQQLWVAEMAEVFKGRHGEGIMVRLDAPLFKMFPAFGEAKLYVHDHPGFASWPAIQTVGKSIASRQSWVADQIQTAFDRAVSKL